MKGFVLWLAVVFIVSASVAGEISPRERDRGLATARKLLSEGRRDEALAELGSLYEEDPQDGAVVRAYVDALIETEDYDRAEVILTRFLKKHPQEFPMRAKLALVNLLQGDSREASKVIDEIIGYAPKEQWTYILAMNVLAEAEDYDGVLEMIARGRRAIGDSTAFSPEAIRLYIDTGRFAGAVHEYLLRSVHEKRGLERLSAEIVDLARRPEATQQVIEALERGKARREFDRLVSEVLWQVYLIAGDCPSALEALKDGIKRYSELARLLPSFATRASEMGCFGECAEAYGLAARSKGLHLSLAEILLKKAECELRANDLEEALQTYETIVERFGGTQWGWDAVLARASIYRQIGRCREAIDEATKIIKNTRSPELLARAIGIKGDCLIQLGNLEAAFETYDLVELELEGEQAQAAFFNLGEIRFYEGEFEEAISYYNVALREYPREDLANDCIERLMLIKGSKAGETYPPELKRLAEAILLERQGDLDGAMSEYVALSETATEAIKVECLRRAAEIYRKLGKHELAIETYRLIGDSLETYFAPSALEAVGDIYAELGQTEKAKAVFEELILRFPESVAAGEARRKIDLLKNLQPTGS